MKLVRGSEVSDFLRCRLRWNYAWVEQIKPKRPDGKLFFGNLFHKWLQVYYNALNIDDTACLKADSAMYDLFKETDTRLMEQTELDELWNLAVEVTNNYVKQWGAQDKKMKVIATELTFAIPLDDEIAYTGTIDLIWKDEDGRLWFDDHKTVSSIDQYTDNAVMDRQISRYWWALQQLSRGNGYILTDNNAEQGPLWVDIKTAGKFLQLTEPHGFRYNLILKDYPTVPEILKKGGLSVAKNQKTTYDVYLNALNERGLIDKNPELSLGEAVPETYHGILKHLQDQETPQGNRFFRRVEVIRNEAEVQAAIQEFYNTAHDAHAISQHGVALISSIYRNVTKDCSWDCQFKSLCLASMDGSNVEMIKNLAYEKREEQLKWNL